MAKHYSDCPYCGGTGIAYEAIRDTKKDEYVWCRLVSCPTVLHVINNLDAVHAIFSRVSVCIDNGSFPKGEPVYLGDEDAKEQSGEDS